MLPRVQGVGIKEGVQASQSALLHGPVHFFEMRQHSMSSCDSVSPTTFGAGAEHSEGVTYTPHKSSSQPLALGDHPNNWRATDPRTE